MPSLNNKPTPAFNRLMILVSAVGLILIGVTVEQYIKNHPNKIITQAERIEASLFSKPFFMDDSEGVKWAAMYIIKTNGGYTLLREKWTLTNDIDILTDTLSVTVDGHFVLTTHDRMNGVVNTITNKP